jgi:hypothetical protein
MTAEEQVLVGVSVVMIGLSLLSLLIAARHGRHERTPREQAKEAPRLHSYRK